MVERSGSLQTLLVEDVLTQYGAAYLNRFFEGKKMLVRLQVEVREVHPIALSSTLYNSTDDKSPDISAFVKRFKFFYHDLNLAFRPNVDDMFILHDDSWVIVGIQYEIAEQRFVCDVGVVDCSPDFYEKQVAQMIKDEWTELPEDFIPGLVEDDDDDEG